MRLKYLGFLLLIVLGLIVWNCEHEAFPYIPETIKDTSGIVLPNYLDENCTQYAEYFEPEIRDLIRSNCSMPGCHYEATDLNGFVVLNKYLEIMSTADVIPGDAGKSELFKVLHLDPDKPEKFMPPIPRPFNQQQINRIKKWINEGAHNNSCYSCDTVDVTYNNGIKQMLRNSCNGCHNNASTLFNADFSTYDEVKKRAPAMLKRMTMDASNSEFMPFKGEQNPCNVHLIDRWIKKGRPE